MSNSHIVSKNRTKSEMALRYGLVPAPTNSEKATKVKAVGIKCWVVFLVEKALFLI